MANRDVILKWTNALRSNEYRQGKAALQRNGKFCCLGVLCDLAVKEGIIAQPTFTRSHIAEYGREKNMLYLPMDVRDWAGLCSRNPRIVPQSGWFSSLSTGNDVLKLSFAEIADLIDEAVEDAKI